MISRRKELVSTVTSRSPKVECPAWAAGVLAKAFSVTVGGSMESGRKELGIPVTTWKGEESLRCLGDSRHDLLVRVRDCLFPAVNDTTKKMHRRKTCQNCQTRG